MIPSIFSRRSENSNVFRRRNPAALWLQGCCFVKYTSLLAAQAAIQALQMQLQEQTAKVDQLRAQGGGGSTAPQIAPGENEAELRLKLQLLEQQKEIEALKAAAVAK